MWSTDGGSGHPPTVPACTAAFDRVKRRIYLTYMRAGRVPESRVYPHMDQIQVGRDNQARGIQFEELCADLYRLLRYQVEVGRLFGARQVDLFLTRRLGDVSLRRAIECKAGPVDTNDLDRFAIKLNLVRREYPDALGTLISGVGFTDAVTTHASKIGIQLTLFKDLEAQLFDGHAYATRLVDAATLEPRYNPDMYVRPSIAADADSVPKPAEDVVAEWLKDPEWRQLTLLGDAGTGKSFLTRITALRLARNYLANPSQNPLPILIDLRHADREFSLEGIVLTHFAAAGLPDMAFDVFLHALRQGRIVLLLDGFDEMAARVTKQVTIRNFNELARSAVGRAKTLLTCRTHYFRSRSEEEEVILGRGSVASGAARDLYWDLIARNGFRIAYLQQFSELQIEEYVAKVQGPGAADSLAKIRSTYNLMELSQRPLMLDMIVRSLDRLSKREINAGTLYEVFTDAWIHRDQWREVITPDHKRAFVMALATALWESDAQTIHYSALANRVHDDFGQSEYDVQELAAIDGEVRTASFLTRNHAGDYGFAHKSYAEFFIAKRMVDGLRGGHVDVLRCRRLSPETVGFAVDLLGTDAVVERALQAVVEAEYAPQLSENALLCLYALRARHVVGHFPEVKQARIPAGAVRLSGAELDQVQLPSIDLAGADLKGAKLTGAVFRGANLTGTLFDNARLDKSDFTGAVCRNASFQNVYAEGATFEGADLSHVSFLEANARSAFFLSANTDGATWQGALLQGAVLDDALRTALDARVATGIGETVGDRSLLDSYWDWVGSSRTKLVKLALMLSAGRVVAWIEPEDLVSDVIVAMASPTQMEELMRLEEPRRLSAMASILARRVRSKSELASWLGAEEEESEDDYGAEDESEAEDADAEHQEAVAQKGVTPDVADVYDDLFREAVIEAEVKAGRTQRDQEREIPGLGVDEWLSEYAAEEDLNIEVGLFIRDMERLLSPSVWRIVQARYVQGLTLAEIAKAEQLPRAEIHRVIQRAKLLLTARNS